MIRTSQMIVTDITPMGRWVDVDAVDQTNNRSIKFRCGPGDAPAIDAVCGVTVQWVRADR